MFNSISWQDFFDAVTLLVAGYYLIASFIFYRSEISNIFNQTKSKSINDELSDTQNDSNESNSLMGGVRFESLTQENVSRDQISVAEEINFAELEEADEAIDGT